MGVVDAIHRALELRLERRYDEAIDVLLAAAREHDDEDLHFEIAGHYAQRALLRPDELARADFDQADKWADLPLTRAGRALRAARAGEIDLAEALAADALEMDPELPMAHLARGAVRLRQGRADEAVDALARAADLQPTFGAAYGLLAEALAALGKPDFAAKALAEGLKHCPGDDALLVAVSRAYLAQEDFGKARRALEQATAANMENAEAWRGLAWIAAKDGDESRMFHALERAVEVDRSGTLAWIAKESATLPGLNAFEKPK